MMEKYFKCLSTASTLTTYFKVMDPNLILGVQLYRSLQSEYY